MLLDKDQWMDAFVNSGKVDLILEEYENIRRDRSRSPETTILFDGEGQSNFANTPREREYAGRKVDLHSFYILDNISALTSDIIYDVRCGMNIFKLFYNTVGIDDLHPNADLSQPIDAAFFIDNQGQFENAISINGLHYCHISDLSSNLVSFFNLIKPGGYGYLAINVEQVVIHTNLTESKPASEIIDIVRDIFNNVVNKTIDLGDVIYFEDTMDIRYADSINGNMRLLLKRNQ